MTTQNNSNKEEKNNIKLNSEEEKNGISITKTISSLISEEKELKKEQNVLSMKIKSSKNSYSKFPKNSRIPSGFFLAKSLLHLRLRRGLGIFLASSSP